MSIKVVAALSLVLAQGRKVDLAKLNDGYNYRQLLPVIPETAEQDFNELCKTLKEQGLLEGQ